MSGVHYELKEYSATVSAREYMRNYRDVDKFLGYCKQCGNYGACWACPPFDHDMAEALKGYDCVTIYATQMIFGNQEVPRSEIKDIIRPVREKIEQRLRALEKEKSGVALAFAGTCLYCPEGTCTRKDGKPCRHPSLVRPSLEALGFDVCKTASDILGIELKWVKGDAHPEYLVLVSGLFHNA